MLAHRGLVDNLPLRRLSELCGEISHTKTHRRDAEHFRKNASPRYYSGASLM